LTPGGRLSISLDKWRRGLLAADFLCKIRPPQPAFSPLAPDPNERTMANTKSARKATRQIAKRTAINKARRSIMRSSVRKVEEAITAGNRNAATTALKEAEPVIMRAAQRGVLHKNNASRKVSRLAHRIAKLAQ
jgi:small subunit ribosomal protein S20